MGMLPIDLQETTAWAVACLRSVGGGEGVVGSLTIFDLVNRITGRAHKVEVKSGGLGVGLPVSGSYSASNYSYFLTRRPVSFRNFNGCAVKIESTNAGYYSTVHLVVKDGTGLLDPILADTRMSGTGWNIPGKSSEEGWAKVLWGNGKPTDESDVASLLPEVKLPSNPDDLDYRIRLKQNDDSLVIKLPADALFAFKEFCINASAEKALHQAGAIIAAWRPRLRRIDIDGHTDSIGSDSVNQPLSENRAREVLKWFKAKKYLNGKIEVNPQGFGKTRPVAPNTRRDGSDDPNGRAQNRRVEIVLVKK